MDNSTAVSKQKKANLEVFIKRVRDDLFAKLKFIHEPEADLALEGEIHSEHQKKCKDLTGGQGVVKRKP
jgi:hypothetical protein